MKAVFALAFLAVANAHHFLYDEGLKFNELAPISPFLTQAMFHKFGFVKPEFDANFISFARSIGAPDFPTISRLHSLFDEPAVMFFMDPMGGIVSYYANSGVENALLSPELKSVFPNVLGAADSMAILYHPDTFLGQYKSVLPGHFFQPSHSPLLEKIMRSGFEAAPLSIDHAIFRKPQITEIFPEVSPVFSRFDIDQFPVAYKSPVALNFFNPAYPAFFPASKSAFPDFDVAHSSPAKVASPFLRSAAPQVFLKSAFPMVPSETPAFEKEFIPTLKFPFAKHAEAFEPDVFPKHSFKFLPYPTTFASVAPFAPVPTAEPFFPVDNLKAFNPFAKAFPGSYPALRFPALFYPTPFFPAAAAAEGFSAAPMIASAVPVAHNAAF